ncbi:MAG: hypothetical protein ABFQ82_05305 [Thermodesulfobacteriota bacterium]
MHFNEIEDLVVEILQGAKGRYMLPYQIFIRLHKLDPALGEKIEKTYPALPGKKAMGKDAGAHYSPASFVAHALDHFRKTSRPEIDKEWFDSSDIEIEGIIPGNKEETSIWAWGQYLKC